MLEIRLPVRACNQVVIYICVYKVETSKDDTDELLGLSCSIPLTERHAPKFVGSERDDYSVRSHGNSVACFVQIDFR